ncbi:hypothetical protein T439DRAFT_325687 [Meredithblackwellia eburnea MCA 4105]
MPAPGRDTAPAWIGQESRASEHQHFTSQQRHCEPPMATPESLDFGDLNHGSTSPHSPYFYPTYSTASYPSTSTWIPVGEAERASYGYPRPHEPPIPDYFGLPMQQTNGYPSMAPTPPYSPLYSPPNQYGLPSPSMLMQGSGSHGVPPPHHRRELSQAAFISPNDVVLGRPSPLPSQSQTWGLTTGPSGRAEVILERPRNSSSSFDGLLAPEAPTTWGNAPPSPRPSWVGSSSSDEIKFGESANSPQGSEGLDESSPPKPESATPFISKLCHLINSPEYDHFIRWSDAGNCFIYAHNSPDLFAAFTRFFRHANIQSFVRQLNIYGFTRVGASELAATMSTSQLASHPLALEDTSAFIHTKFYRDEPGNECPVHELKPRGAKKKQSKGQISNTSASSSATVSAAGGHYKHGSEPEMKLPLRAPGKRNKKAEVLKRTTVQVPSYHHLPPPPLPNRQGEEWY